MVKPTVTKNLISSVKDLQMQIEQLKAEKKEIISKTIWGSNLKLCDADGVSFSKGDVVFVENEVVKEYTGSETLSDDILSGIVKIGNVQDTSREVVVLVKGMDYAYVTEDVEAGQKLYIDSDNLRKLKLSGDSSPFYVAVESGDVNTFVKVKIAEGVSPESDTVVCSIINKISYGFYTVRRYDDYPDTSTFVETRALVLQEHFDEDLIPGTFIVANIYRGTAVPSQRVS